MKDAIRSMMKAELGDSHYTGMLHELEEIGKYYKAYQEGLDWDNLWMEMDYTPTKKKSNKIKQLIKDEARFLFGKPPEIKLISSDDKLAVGMQNYIDETLRKNLFQSKLIKAAKDCFIGGRVALKLGLAQDGSYIRIMFLPADSFLFEPAEDDVDEIKKIVFFYVVRDAEDAREQRIWRQKYEMDSGRCMLNEAVYDGNGELVDLRFKNYDTGLPFIPAYVIINDGLSGDFKGESDVADLLSNQLEYNRLVSEDIDTLRKGMNQIIYGMDIDGSAISHFQIKPGAFWDVPTDPSRAENGNQAAIGTISNDFGYDSRIEHALRRIENEMYAALKVPNVSPEELQGFITSGKSMKALYWQLMARCQEKFLDWQPALVWMVHAIIEMSQSFQILNSLSGKYTVQAENQFPLPEDEESEKAVDLSEVAAGVMSRKRYIEKWIVKDAARAEEELSQLEKEKIGNINSNGTVSSQQNIEQQYEERKQKV